MPEKHTFKPKGYKVTPLFHTLKTLVVYTTQAKYNIKNNDK